MNKKSNTNSSPAPDHGKFETLYLNKGTFRILYAKAHFYRVSPDELIDHLLQPGKVAALKAIAKHSPEAVPQGTDKQRYFWPPDRKLERGAAVDAFFIDHHEQYLELVRLYPSHDALVRTLLDLAWFDMDCYFVDKLTGGTPSTSPPYAWVAEGLGQDPQGKRSSSDAEPESDGPAA